jgi:orotate phosphoribosyltransferase
MRLLQKLIIDHAVKKQKPGDPPFLLSSGHTSDILVDLSIVLSTTEGQLSLASEVYGYPMPSTIAAIGGPLSGSDLVAFAFISRGFPRNRFGVRKTEKHRGYDQGLITGSVKPGDEVILVEDQITAFGCKIVQIFCVVDRGGLKIASSALNVPGTRLYQLEDLV